MDLMNQSPSALLLVQLTCLLVLMAQNVFINLESVIERLIVQMDLMKIFLPVPSYLSAQMISLLVLMARNVFMNHNDVMEDLIVKIIQMKVC